MGRRPSTSGAGRVGDVQTSRRGLRDESVSRERYHSFSSDSEEPMEPVAQHSERSSRPQPLPRQPSIVQQSSSANVSSNPAVPPGPTPSTANRNVSLPGKAPLKIKVVQASSKVKPIFLPSAATVISKSFKQSQYEGGTEWKTLPNEALDFYWNEFVKGCTWTQPNHDVRSAWDVIAPVCYSTWLYRLKKQAERPRWCNPDVLIVFKAYWNKDNVKAKSVIKAANRRGNSGNPPSIHVGGSKSHFEHMMDIFEKTGTMPNLLCHFRDMHQRKNEHGEKVFIDAKSKLLNEKIEGRMRELQGEHEANGEVVEVDENKLFLQVLAEMGGLEKGRAYGIGNRVSTITSDGSSSSGATSRAETPSMTQEQIVEVISHMVTETVSEQMVGLFEKVLHQISKGTQPSHDGSNTCEGMEESDDDAIETNRIVLDDV